MSPLFVYLLKASATVFILWAFYFLCLRRMTFHRLNRYFFIAGIIVSFVWPALPLDEWFFQAPQVPQVVVYIPVSAFMLQFQHETPTFGIEQFLKICYFGGVLFMLIRLGIQIISLRTIFKRSEKQIIQGIAIQVIREEVNPFSFFGYIFLNPANHTATELNAIIEHEKVHNHRAHSIDILLSELVKIVLWFNPFSWLFCKAVKENIEFEVDRILLHQGINCKEYQYSLLKLSAIKNQNSITNHFNLSNLKIRIIMMNKKKSSRLGLATYALVIPILLFSMAISVAFAQDKLPGKKSAQKTIAVLKDNLAGKNPLILLDGVVITKKKMDEVPSDQIESVNVLKGENATKNYGEKGKDGVILVTSKKGDNAKNTGVSIRSTGNSTIPDNVLFIVDGVTYDKDAMKSLNPDRIESMDVLKNESATKLYGEKGKNGVIIITTKKNVSINSNVSSNVSVNTNVSVKPTLNDVTVVGYGNSTGREEVRRDTTKMKFSAKDLYILLDGNEIDEAKMKAINPEDILKIDVLKGESATAAYGNKAKNGAILITLKKR